MYTCASSIKNNVLRRLISAKHKLYIKNKKYRELINDIKAVQQYTGIKDYITVMSDKLYMLLFRFVFEKIGFKIMIDYDGL